MIRRYTSKLSTKECKDFIRENLDAFSIPFGDEYMTGWTKLGFFSVSYKMGKWQRNYWVFNKSIGRISSRRGTTRVTFVTFRGLTDPLSLLLQLFGIYIMLSVAQGMEIMNAADKWLIAGCFTAVLAIISWIYTTIHPDGAYAEKEMIDYLERNIATTRRVKA